MAVGMGLQNAAKFKLVPHYVPKAVGGAAGWARGTGSLRDFRDAWQPCRLESKAFVIYPSREHGASKPDSTSGCLCRRRLHTKPPKLFSHHVLTN